MKYRFYTLSDPDTLEVRYVGVTTNSLATRFAQHKYSTKRITDNTHKSKWFKSVMERGKLPIITKVKTYTCEDDSWELIEKELISSYTNLTNHHVGGKGVIKGERKRTTAFNNKPVVKIHPWKNIVLETYINCREAEVSQSGKITGIISQTVNGKHTHAFGYRWSFAEPIKFPKPLKYYFLCVDGKIIKEYSSKAAIREDFTRITNTYDVWGITTNIPSVSQKK